MIDYYSFWKEQLLVLKDSFVDVDNYLNKDRKSDSRWFKKDVLSGINRLINSYLKSIFQSYTPTQPNDLLNVIISVKPSGTNFIYKYLRDYPELHNKKIIARDLGRNESLLIQLDNYKWYRLTLSKKYTSWVKKVHPYYEEYEIIRSEIRNVPKYYTAQQLIMEIYNILSPLLNHDYGTEDNDFFHELISSLCPKFNQFGEWENWSSLIDSRTYSNNPDAVYRNWGEYFIRFPETPLHLDDVSDIKELIIYNLSIYLNDFTIIPLQHGTGYCDNDGERLFKSAIHKIGEL